MENNMCETVFPKRCFKYAIFFSILYVLALALKLDRFSAVLSGTLPRGEVDNLIGVIFILLHFVFVVIVPVMIISGVLQLLFFKFCISKKFWGGKNEGASE